MGSHLGASYGSDYVNLGFAFGHGHFNAVGVNAPLQAWDAELIPPNSIEARSMRPASNSRFWTLG
jgi:hypothetical protein